MSQTVFMLFFLLALIFLSNTSEKNGEDRCDSLNPALIKYVDVNIIQLLFSGVVIYYHFQSFGV